jgi:peptidyl-prolyl cis-trans isomerase NIMA-interacting 1
MSASDTEKNDDSWIDNALRENPPPDALPDGWIVRHCRSQPGHVYYYNQETGDSQWEKPAMKTNLTVIPTETQTSQVDNGASLASSEKSPTFSVISSSAAVHQKRPLESQSQLTMDRPQPVVTTAVETTVPESKRSKTSTSIGNTDKPKEVRVLHILRKHRGSRRPSSWRNSNITSTVEEATQELRDLIEVLQEVKDNPVELQATFEELARTESDCSSAKRGGDLGFFGKKKMQPSFEQASFALRIGEMSDIVQSASGAHIILRIG